MTIELPLEPQQEAIITSLANSRGVTTSEIVREALEPLFQKIQPDRRTGTVGAAAAIVFKHFSKLRPEDRTMPSDGASEHDHYIYGSPRRGD